MNKCVDKMNLDKEKQKYINGVDTAISLEDINKIYMAAHAKGVQIRINTNIFHNNNDTVEEMLVFYNALKDRCDSLKFSPLLKTDSFSTVNEVTKFNNDNLLTDHEYDSLWQGLEQHFADVVLVRNKETFGFVEYSMLMLPVPIILNYNQHGQLRSKVINEHKINNIKLLPNGELSLTWNREEIEFILDTTEGC